MITNKLTNGVTVVKLQPAEIDALVRVIEPTTSHLAEQIKLDREQIKKIQVLRDQQPEIAHWAKDEELHKRKASKAGEELKVISTLLEQLKITPPEKKQVLIVIFRIINGAVEAFFPFEPGTSDSKTMSCFSLVDGHCTAVKEYADKGERAVECEFKSTLQKLKQLYSDYQLKVMFRFPSNAQKVRADKIAGRYSIDKNADVAYNKASQPKGA